MMLIILKAPVLTSGPRCLWGPFFVHRAKRRASFGGQLLRSPTSTRETASRRGTQGAKHRSTRLPTKTVDDSEVGSK